MEHADQNSGRLPFLSARWSNLILLTYAVPKQLLQPRLPPNCELDTIDGDAFVSLVAFDFLDVRVLGIRWPGHVNFPEINLRFYVRHGQDRGVVFVREFVPRRAIATIARIFYNEPYRTASMSSRVTQTADAITVNHTARIDGITQSIQVIAGTETRMPTENELEHFFKEHTWGFGTSRRGRLLSYRVDHPPWLVHPVQKVELNWDWRACYGDDFAFLQNQPPCSRILAIGSPVTVYPKRSIRD